MAEGSTRGGPRQGAGRPKGSKNTVKRPVRPSQVMRAFDDEWEIVKRFAYYLKHGRREECEKFINEMNRKYDNGKE